MSDGLTQLIGRIDDAVRLRDPATTTQHVKSALQDAIRARTLDLPERFHYVRPEGYARRLLHRNDDLGYTAVVMTWGPGQKTALHDHAGIWCVECVMDGKMEVAQFDLTSERDGAFRFEERTRVMAGRGSAGCLIPPFEYHTLGNAAESASITLHVYGGEMTTCHVFEPTAHGRYLRRERALSYHD